MIRTMPETPLELLEVRLARGAELLFDLEQRGDTDAEYVRFLRHFETLLNEYERCFANDRAA